MPRDYSFFVGDIALDEYYRAPYWPQLREKVLVKALPPAVGGMIANAASVYAGYNETVRFLALLNRRSITQVLCEDLRRQGIDTSYIQYDDTLPDSKTIIILTEDDHTVFIPTLGIQHIDVTPPTIEAMGAAQYVYSTIAEFKPLRCGNLTAVDIARRIRAAGAKLVYDLDVAHIEPADEIYFTEVDIAFFNRKGFEVYRNGAGYAETVSRLLGYGTEIVVVTLAEAGCRVHTRDGDSSVPGIPVAVADVTGAGDTFCSSFIYALGKGAAPRTAAGFANAAAARSVTILGPRGGVAAARTVVDFMRQHGVAGSSEYDCLLK